MFLHLFGITDLRSMDNAKYRRFKAYADKQMSGGPDA